MWPESDLQGRIQGGAQDAQAPLQPQTSQPEAASSHCHSAKPKHKTSRFATLFKLTGLFIGLKATNRSKNFDLAHSMGQSYGHFRRKLTN